MERPGIVICATPGERGWLLDLQRSIKTDDYPVLAYHTWDFELSAIEFGAEMFEEFVLLPQSTIVLDNSLWHTVFETFEGLSVSLSQTPNPFGMYLGKYRSEIVKQVGVPEVRDKVEAVIQEEAWTKKYISADPEFIVLGDMPDTQVFEERYGRRNMIVESKYLRRYKGCWNGSTLKAANARARASKEKWLAEEAQRQADAIDFITENVALVVQGQRETTGDLRS